MTFPFSTHNYHLRFWMAAGGVDPDEDVRLVVLPPPYMVESLANRHVDGFCVGAPWNSVAVDLGIGYILHFVSEILSRAAEKVLAVRASWADENPDVLRRLVRAHRPRRGLRRGCRPTATKRLRSSRRRTASASSAEVIRRTLDGRMKVAPDGTIRTSDRYLLVGRNGAARPDPVQAAWLYAQMVRWGQAPLFGRDACRGEGSVPSRPLRRGVAEPKLRIRRASRPMASAHSPARRSTPMTSSAISRPGRSGDSRLPIFCTAQNIRRVRSRWAWRPSLTLRQRLRQSTQAIVKIEETCPRPKLARSLN